MGNDAQNSTTLSPTKKRQQSTEPEEVMTPKKLRTLSYLHSSPSPFRSRDRPSGDLPMHLDHLLSAQTKLQQYMTHALASSAISPTEDTGIVNNVLNHIILRKRGIELSDFQRLCWLWEWDGVSVPSTAADDSNPFLTRPSETKWQRGGMGVVITPTTFFDRDLAKRIPVYGVGIEVEMDLDKGFTDGMAAVARWTGDSMKRREMLHEKLQKWKSFYASDPNVPQIPVADLPTLSNPTATSGLLLLRGSSRPPSPVKTPSPRMVADLSTLYSPTPSTSSQHPLKDFSALPSTQTPRRAKIDPLSLLKTPSSSPTKLKTPVATPSSKETSVPATPTSQRRAALYERIRLKSTSKVAREYGASEDVKDAFGTHAKAALRRRCLLGRLSGVAEGIWMLFSGPASSKQERRALRLSTVVHSIVKSSPVPISEADAEESVSLLIDICPFFLKRLVVGREEWIEMPGAEGPPLEECSSTTLAEESLPSKQTSSPRRVTVPSSPGLQSDKLRLEDIAGRSPRTVRRAAVGGLGRVRETIRRELEFEDQ